MTGQTAAVTVHIWPLAISARRLDDLHGLLSADELARAERIHVPEVARDFIASHGVARELLAVACGCEPRDLRFEAGRHGKPYLAHPSNQLAFNLSHSGGYGALATGTVPRLGLDIEAIRATVGDLPKSVFTPREATQYAAISEEEKMRAFFRAWVAKEAYLKAIGEGLGGGLQSLELDLAAGKEINPVGIRGHTTALSKWKFQGFEVSARIVGAVAVDSSASAIDIIIRFVQA